MYRVDKNLFWREFDSPSLVIVKSHHFYNLHIWDPTNSAFSKRKVPWPISVSYHMEERTSRDGTFSGIRS